MPPNCCAALDPSIRPDGSADGWPPSWCEMCAPWTDVYRRIAGLDERIAGEVKASGTMLTEIFGVGPILAAKILGIVGDVSRFPSKAHFASYAGVAPIEASSGEVVRHKLSLAGNRRLNQVMHMIAVCQARSDPRGGTYHRKKLAEGKSRREAMRCLKRRISDAVFRVLVTDSQLASPTVS